MAAAELARALDAAGIRGSVDPDWGYGVTVRLDRASAFQLADLLDPPRRVPRVADVEPVDWSLLRPAARVLVYDESLAITPLDACGAPITEQAQTIRLAGRCTAEKYLGDDVLAPVRCERTNGHRGTHWAYGKEVW